MIIEKEREREREREKRFWFSLIDPVFGFDYFAVLRITRIGGISFGFEPGSGSMRFYRDKFEDRKKHMYG